MVGWREGLWRLVNDFHTDDPVEPERFVADLLLRGYKINSISHPSASAASNCTKQAAPENDPARRSSIGKNVNQSPSPTEALGKSNTLGNSREPPV
jgi:hypothetical protein